MVILCVSLRKDLSANEDEMLNSQGNNQNRFSEMSKFRDKTSLDTKFYFYEKNTKEGGIFYQSFRFGFILWKQN